MYNIQHDVLYSVSSIVRDMEIYTQDNCEVLDIPRPAFGFSHLYKFLENPNLTLNSKTLYLLLDAAMYFNCEKVILACTDYIRHDECLVNPLLSLYFAQIYGWSNIEIQAMIMCRSCEVETMLSVFVPSAVVVSKILCQESENQIASISPAMVDDQFWTELILSIQTDKVLTVMINEEDVLRVMNNSMVVKSDAVSLYANKINDPTVKYPLEMSHYYPYPTGGLSVGSFNSSTGESGGTCNDDRLIVLKTNNKLCEMYIYEFAKLCVATMCKINPEDGVYQEHHILYAHPIPATQHGYHIMKQPRVFAACAYLNDNIYVIGGMSHFSCRLYSAVDKFNLVTKCWSTVASLNKPRCGGMSLTQNQKIFVYGGSEPQAEYYTPDENVWNIIHPSSEKVDRILDMHPYDDSTLLVIESLGNLVVTGYFDTARCSWIKCNTETFKCDGNIKLTYR